MATIKDDISHSFVKKMTRFYKAGILESPQPNRMLYGVDDLPSLADRVKKILGLATIINTKPDFMLFFVMYDIESDKVRNQVVKYLQRQGCTRVQKSIFLANLPTEKYNTIKQDLVEVQAAYENQDSILIVPISTDLLQAMKIIGQNIEVDVITQSKSTLFF